MNCFYIKLWKCANTDGGCILLGVRDDKSIEGFNGQQEGVINQIIDCLGIQPKIEVENIQDKEILLVKVEKSNNLIAYKNIYLWRQNGDCESRWLTRNRYYKQY